MEIFKFGIAQRTAEETSERTMRNAVNTIGECSSMSGSTWMAMVFFRTLKL